MAMTLSGLEFCKLALRPRQFILRTRTTVPSRISRTIGSSVSERAFHASQSLFTLRHARLTVSLHCASEQGGQRAAHTTRVGAGEVAVGDQRVGGQRAALVGPQGPAFPFGGLALGGLP